MYRSTCLCSRAEAPTQSLGSRIEDHANVYFPPPVIHALAILLGLIAAEFMPLALPASFLLGGFAVGLFMMAMVIAGWAFRQFAHSGNAVPPNQPIGELMRGGPFRYSRNPLYLALGLIHAGIGLISGNAWVVLTLLPAVLVVRYYVIAREEAYLTRRFGQAYLDYQARVRRWF